METSKVIAAQNLDGYCFRDVPAIADGYTTSVSVGSILYLCKQERHIERQSEQWTVASHIIVAKF